MKKKRNNSKKKSKVSLVWVAGIWEKFFNDDSWERIEEIVETDKDPKDYKEHRLVPNDYMIEISNEEVMLYAEPNSTPKERWIKDERVQNLEVIISWSRESIIDWKDLLSYIDATDG